MFSTRIRAAVVLGLLGLLGVAACSADSGPELGTRAAVDPTAAPVVGAVTDPEVHPIPIVDEGLPVSASDAGGRGTTPGIASVGSSASFNPDAGSQATWPLTCGDGVLDPGESCDVGNTLGGGGCSAECCLQLGLSLVCVNGWSSSRRAPCHCGDGFLAPGEQCDDGNLIFGDGCSGYCEMESGTCADGTLDPGETCDDGNRELYDGCDPGCGAEFNCHPVPATDGGASASCGNGIVEPGETCDDGNTLSGDQCDAMCLLECGNGRIDGREQCDDGDPKSAAGCIACGHPTLL